MSNFKENVLGGDQRRYDKVIQADRFRRSRNRTGRRMWLWAVVEGAGQMWESSRWG